MSAESRRYRGFISHSPEDKPAARRLHRALERYVAPKGVEAAGLDPRTRKLGRFFRDDEEMGSAADLGATVTGAIEDSEGLIVVCSPRAARSHRVNEVAERYKRSRRADRIFAVIVDGRPNAGDETECFPPALRPQASDGSMPVEPLGIDLRRESLARARARIAAGLLRVPFDDLWKRDQRRTQLRLVQSVAAALVAIALGAVALGGTLVAQQRQALTARAEQLAQAAHTAMNEGRFDRGARFALAGLNNADALLFNIPVADAEAELRHALAGPVVLATLAMPGDVTVSAAAYNRDGVVVVVLGSDGLVRIWDPAADRVVQTLRDETGAILRAEFSADGASVFTYTALAGRVWDASTGRVTATIQDASGASLRWASFSPSGASALTLAVRSIRQWDVRRGRVVRVFDAPAAGREISGANFAGDDRIIISDNREWHENQNVDFDQHVARIWNAQTGELITTIRGLTYQSPRQDFLAARSHDNTTTVWSVGSGRQVMSVSDGGTVTFSSDAARLVTQNFVTPGVQLFDRVSGRLIARLEAGGGVFGPVFSADGTHVAAMSLGAAVVWDAATGREIARLDDYRSRLNEVSLSSDGARALTTSTDTNAIVLWDVRTRGMLASIHAYPRGPAAGFEYNAAAALSPDGRYILTRYRGVVQVWDAAAPDVMLTGHTSVVLDVAFSPDGTRVVSGSSDGTARVWVPASGEPPVVLRGHTNLVFATSINAAGSRVLTASVDGAVRLWDVASGRSIGVIGGPNARVRAAKFSPDGSMFVTAGDNGARLWDAASGREQSVLVEQRGGVNAAFSPDGSFLVTASSGNAVQVWNVASRAAVATLRGHRGLVNNAQFSPDSARIVTASDDHDARVWDAQSGATIATLSGHQANVVAATFSPSGRRAATASEDGTARVWDSANGRALVTLIGHRQPLLSVRFITEDLLLTLAQDGSARLWDVVSGRVVREFFDGAVSSVAASADGAYIATGSADGAVRVWRLHPALFEGRAALRRRACGHALGGGLSRFSTEEFRAAPLLNQALDSDACRPSSVWARLNPAFF